MRARDWKIVEVKKKGWKKEREGELKEKKVRLKQKWENWKIICKIEKRGSKRRLKEKSEIEREGKRVKI